MKRWLVGALLRLACWLGHESDAEYRVEHLRRRPITGNRVAVEQAILGVTAAQDEVDFEWSGSTLVVRWNRWLGG